MTCLFGYNSEHISFTFLSVSSSGKSCSPLLALSSLDSRTLISCWHAIISLKFRAIKYNAAIDFRWYLRIEQVSISRSRQEHPCVKCAAASIRLTTRRHFLINFPHHFLRPSLAVFSFTTTSSSVINCI